MPTFFFFGENLFRFLILLWQSHGLWIFFFSGAHLNSNVEKQRLKFMAEKNISRAHFSVFSIGRQNFLVNASRQVVACHQVWILWIVNHLNGVRRELLQWNNVKFIKFIKLSDGRFIKNVMHVIVRKFTLFFALLIEENYILIFFFRPRVHIRIFSMALYDILYKIRLETHSNSNWCKLCNVHLHFSSILVETLESYKSFSYRWEENPECKNGRELFAFIFILFFFICYTWIAFAGFPHDWNAEATQNTHSIKRMPKLNLCALHENQKWEQKDIKQEERGTRKEENDFKKKKNAFEFGTIYFNMGWLLVLSWK